MAAIELDDPKRFAFGQNWSRFLSTLNEERIKSAEDSLKEMLGCDNLRGKRFLDIGSGSGLFSLAARRMGGDVHSFDYDTESVACTRELRRLFFPDDGSWSTSQGSVLDPGFMAALGTYDVVYSWGVLHHTGAMWVGIEHALQRVRDGGQLYIAIYNDQGLKSHFWWFIKYIYNKLPSHLNRLFAYGLGSTAILLNILKYTIKLRPMAAIRPLLHYDSNRGMSVVHDMVDWIGGFPFEVARFDVLQAYMAARGFVLTKGARATSLGCHQMVFAKQGQTG